MQRLRRKYASGEHATGLGPRALWTYRLRSGGVMARLQYLQVDRPLIVHSCGSQRCVIDAGYTWLSYYPTAAPFVLTLMLDADWQPIQWYLDLCAGHGVDERGVPWCDDLFLDVVLLPDGAFELLDDDELEEAYRRGRITRAQRDGVRVEARHLIGLCRMGALGLVGESEEHARLLSKGEAPGVPLLERTAIASTVRP